ncbi:MAG: hypothetical protein ACRDOH_13505, partial [Streptosporangiaceae bacterium]
MGEMTSREGPSAAAAPAGQLACRWEYEDGQQCTRPPAPRRGARGPAPVYCEQADGPGQPAHNPLNAWRAKTRPADADDDDTQAARTPVAEAIKTAGNTLDRAEQLAAALRETAEHLAEALATAGNPDAAAAQIDAQLADVREEAARQKAAADRETAARLTAEARAGEARQMAEGMAGQAEAAQADAEAARADASAARAGLRDRIIEHEQARQAIRQEADQAIAGAHTDAAERIAAAEAGKDAAARAAAARAEQAEQQAREAIEQALA